MKRFWAPVTLAVILFSPLRSFALPGEADAVVRHCGAPSRDFQAVSSVTDKLQRNLVYGNTVLRFDQIGSDWTYASAWRGRFPVSLTTAEAALPCVSDAMNEVAKSPAFVTDPTIAADQTAPSNVGIRFGKPFLWLIAALAVILFVSIALPATRRRVVRRPELENRPYRRPKAHGIRFARRRRNLQEDVVVRP